MDFKPVGRRIKLIRESKHLTQEKLGEMKGLTGPYISTVERGIKTPTLPTFIKIANALNVSIDSLLVDFLNTSIKFKSDKLSDQIKDLPAKDQIKILEVVSILVESEK